MKPQKKTELLKGNLLDHWEYEVNNFGGGNQERQMYVDSPEFVHMEDGELVITAKRKEANICGHIMPYSSGRVRTKRRFDFRYGTVIFEAKLPFVKGLWPAVWMLPTDNVYGQWPASGEIDILEAKNDESETIYHALHFGPDWSRREMVAQPHTFKPNPDGWQHFCFIWHETGMGWYVNGAQSLHVDKTAPFDQDFHLIINLAVGGGFVGMEPDPGWQQSEMRIRDLVVETRE